MSAVRRAIIMPGIMLAVLFANACTGSPRHPRSAGADTSGAANAVLGLARTVTGTASAERLGTVHVIGTGQRFVLVQTTSAQAIPTLVDGQALVCRAAGSVTATLRVSHERRPPFVVADVATGEPHVGDEVFIETAPGRAAVSAPSAADSPTPAATPEFRANPALPPTR